MPNFLCKILMGVKLVGFSTWLKCSFKWGKFATISDLGEWLRGN
jgi:hypothetical protein